MYEFDPAKSRVNKAKHGIDFSEAQALWKDERRVENDAQSAVEVRRLLVARLNEIVWCAVFTMRGPAIRIISVRRARKDEVRAYERKENDRG